MNKCRWKIWQKRINLGPETFDKKIDVGPWLIKTQFWVNYQVGKKYGLNKKKPIKHENLCRVWIFSKKITNMDLDKVVGPGKKIQT